jgi:hypothetical protein
MIELNFLAFCITVIALTAIVFGREDIAGEALTMLSGMAKEVLTTFGRIFTKKIDNQ